MNPFPRKPFPFYALLLSSILLLFTFLYRIIDTSKILRFFPLDAVNDLSSYMAQLFFLHTCGFHVHCPYWYGGFTNFLFQAPGWYFFTSPLYLLFHDVTLATYLSLLLIIFIAFLIILFLYKKLQFSLLQRIALFSLFFGNAIAIGNFIRLGRVHELLAWVIFLAFAVFFLSSEKPLRPSFIFTGILYALIILCNPNVAILASLFYVSLFLIKPSLQERTWIVLSALLGITLSSFWWYPFLINLSQSFIVGENLGAHSLVFNNLLLPTHIITSLIMIVFIFLYLISRRHNSAISLFYLPFFILSLLVLSKLISFIPVLDDLLIDYYNVLFIFLIIILLYRSHFLSKKITTFLYTGIILASLISVGYTFFITPSLPVPDADVQDVTSLLPYAYGNFIIHGTFPQTLYSKAIYSYAPIYHNLTTPAGWYPHVASQTYNAHLVYLLEHLGKDCSSTTTLLSDWNITSVLSSQETCAFYANCGFTNMTTRGNFCVINTSLPQEPTRSI